MATATLPKNYWTIIERFLPNYYSREDVAQSNDMQVELEGMRGAPKEAKDAVKGLILKLDSKLYAEAMKAKKALEASTAKKLTKKPVKAVKKPELRRCSACGSTLISHTMMGHSFICEECGNID